MVQAHEAQMAESQVTRADITKGINAAKDHAIEQLVALKGAHFDQQFANDQVAAERHDLAVYKREAAHGANSDVKAYATKTIPVLEKDLKQAEACTKPVAHS